MTDATDLFRQMLDMSEGDRSMLKVVAMGKAPDDAQFTTSPDSRNFRLWSAMVEKGWMVRLTDVIPDPKNHPNLAMPSFAVTDAGRSIMPDFLAAFARFRNGHMEKMANVFNTLCLNFVKEFREQTVKGSATEKDFVLLASATVARLVSNNLLPQHHENMLETIFEEAKKILKAPGSKAN